MTNEPELLAELVKANKSLIEMKKYLKFTNTLQICVLSFGIFVLFAVYSIWKEIF